MSAMDTSTCLPFCPPCVAAFNVRVDRNSLDLRQAQNDGEKLIILTKSYLWSDKSNIPTAIS